MKQLQRQFLQPQRFPLPDLTDYLSVLFVERRNIKKNLKYITNGYFPTQFLQDARMNLPKVLNNSFGANFTSQMRDIVPIGLRLDKLYYHRIGKLRRIYGTEESLRNYQKYMVLYNTSSFTIQSFPLNSRKNMEVRLFQFQIDVSFFGSFSNLTLPDGPTPFHIILTYCSPTYNLNNLNEYGPDSAAPKFKVCDFQMHNLKSKINELDVQKKYNPAWK